MIPLALVGMRYSRNVFVNGSIDGSVSNWASFGSPTTFEHSNGRIHVVCTGATKGFQQAVTLVLNEQYALLFDYEVVSGGFTVAKVGMTTTITITGSGKYSQVFRESDGTNRNANFFSTDAGSNEWYIDNIRYAKLF